MPRSYAVIGAGPGGCAVATYLARGGNHVVLLDAHDPPQEAVGESLLPVCAEILSELGVDMSDFLVKRGAVFMREGAVRRFDFAAASNPVATHAWQAKRRPLDRKLRDAAVAAGATFLHARVTAIDLNARALATTAGQVSFDHLIDASGRAMVLARHLGLRKTHPSLRNAAVGAHWRGVQRGDVGEIGDVVLPVFEGGWFWFIPFADGTWSAGCVTTPGFRSDPAHKALGPARARLQTALDRCPDAAHLLREAEPLSPVMGTADYTASASRLHGDGWSMVGDAASFIDPVFSSGIALALQSGRWLAEALENDDLEGYEERVREVFEVFTDAVLAFYDGTFLDVAFSQLPPAGKRAQTLVISLLAGDVFGPNTKGARRIARRFGDLARLMKTPAS